MTDRRALVRLILASLVEDHRQPRLAEPCDVERLSIVHRQWREWS